MVPESPKGSRIPKSAARQSRDVAAKREREREMDTERERELKREGWN
jgi:hypothetical protein